MTETWRTVVTSIAVVLFGFLSLPSFAEDAIGDPWWDEAASLPLPARDTAKAFAGLPVQPGRDRFIQQRREAGLDVLRGELAVVRATCPDLAPDARRAIVAAGIETLDVLGHAERVRRNDDVSGAGPPGPLVVAAVGRAVTKHATAPEAEAYRRELGARGERRRAAAIAVLVEAVDQTAMLDDDQRERLAAVLHSKWQPFWERATIHVGHARMTGAHLPPGVAPAVAEVLGPEEFNAWQERLRQLRGS